MGSFSRVILQAFVLSRNVPKVNTRAIWFRFGAFLSSPARFLRIHWPLAPVFSPLATTFPPSARPAGSGRAQTLPRWILCHQPHELSKAERGPISTSSPTILVCHRTTRFLRTNQMNPFLLARRRPTVNCSVVGGGAQRQQLQACLPDGHQSRCLFFSPCFPSGPPAPPTSSSTKWHASRSSTCSATPTPAPPTSTTAPTRRSPAISSRGYSSNSIQYPPQGTPWGSLSRSFRRHSTPNKLLPCYTGPIRTGRLNPVHTRFSRHSMNEDQTPLFGDAESSNSDILRVARERAEVAYLKSESRWDARSCRIPLGA